jgi:HPt (histidine-containing phosphotransfer) domain-containing protein
VASRRLRACRHPEGSPQSPSASPAFQAITAAYQARQFKDLQRLAHQLKGASAGYGFPSIGEVAARVEAGLKTPQPSAEQTVAGIASSVNELIQLCQRASAKPG